MEKITGGNDFNLVIRAKRRTGTEIEDLSLIGIDDLQIFLTRAGRSKIMMSYALDVNGCAIIYVDKDDVAKGVWGVEMKGKCEGADLRAHEINAFEIVGSMGTNGVLADYVVEVVFAVNIAASGTFVQEAIAAHNEDVTAHPSLIEAIGNAGKVDDVMVDGESIVDEDKVAHIDSDKFGKVDDVVVNGESVVYDKVANITIPTKVSDLDNDSDYVTETEAEQMVEDATTVITIGETTTGEPGTDAEVTNTGTDKAPVLNFTIPQGEQGIQGEKGAQGDSVLVGQGDLPLAHVLGNDNTKAMSQKGVTDEILKTPTIRDAQSEADLDIADAEGNVLVRMSGGHIKTKYFDSESVVLPSGNSIGNSDLDITDEQGNVLLRIGAGHVKTKYFDSSDIKTDIFKRTNFVGSPSLYLPDYDSEDPVLFDNSSEVYAAYDGLVTQYPQYFAAKGTIGMDESGTYDVNLYQLGWQNRKITNQRDGSGTNTYSETTQKPTRLLVCAGTHPNETPSIYGCWWGIKSILESNEPWAVWIKSNLILDIVPLMQPWGLNHGHVETNVNGKNINRTYYTDKQQENINMINLIADLMGKGLKGVIDCHNTGNTHNDGYLVSKPSYPYWYWYTELAQNISAMTNPLFEAVFGTTKNHFHCWDSSEFDGQLHDYVNSLGLLGCTFEIRKWLYDGTSNPKPIVAQLTRAILVNIINAFATFNDKR